MPSFEAIENVAQEKGIAFQSREELVAHPDIITFFRERVDQRSADLARYETIKAFTLLPQEFSQDSGEITPTQKIRRKVIEQHFSLEIEAMYPDDSPSKGLTMP